MAAGGLKWLPGGDPLDAEADGLRQLSPAIRVPAVIHRGPLAGGQALILEWLDLRPLSGSGWETLGVHLRRLHDRDFQHRTRLYNLYHLLKEPLNTALRTQRGLQAGPHSSFPFFDRQPACLQKGALIVSQPVSLSTQGGIQRLLDHHNLFGGPYTQATEDTARSLLRE